MGVRQPTQVNRRQFLGGLLKTATGVGLLGLGLGLYARRSASRQASSRDR